MPTSLRALSVLVAVAALTVGAPRAAEDPALLKDLTAVITLLGLPCGEVVGATRQADKDHIASCKSGARYRVFVNAEGRVVAEKQ